MDRLSEFTARIDSDPRIVSAVARSRTRAGGQWLRACRSGRPADRRRRRRHGPGGAARPRRRGGTARVAAARLRARALARLVGHRQRRCRARRADPGDRRGRRSRGGRSQQLAPLDTAPLPTAWQPADDHRGRHVAGPLRDRIPGAHDLGPGRAVPPGLCRGDPAGGAGRAAGVCEAPGQSSARPGHRTRRESAALRCRVVPEPDRRAQQHCRCAPAGRAGRGHVPRPDRLRHPPLSRITPGLARLPGPAAAHRAQRRRHHHDQRRRRAAPPHGGAAPRARPDPAAAARPGPHHA